MGISYSEQMLRKVTGVCVRYLKQIPNQCKYIIIQ